MTARSGPERQSPCTGGAAPFRAALAALLLASAALPAQLATPASSAEPAPPAKPQRIVSLNLCTDVLLADLAPRHRVAAVSVLGPDPQVSAVATDLAGWPTVRGEAEEVLALDADLVLTVAGARPQTVDLLRRLGRRVVTVPLAADFDAIRRAVTTVADAVGEPERGRTLLARFDARLASAAAKVRRASATSRPASAVAVQVGNLVSGPESLIDHALTAAGFDNAAAHRPLGPGGRLPLEALVSNPPDLVILANDPAEFRTAAADNLRHPAFRALLAARPHITLPLPQWICGTPRIADAVDRLADARLGLPSRAAP